MILKITKDNVDAAFAALAKTAEAKGTEDIQGAIHKFGWHATIDAKGDIIRLRERGTTAKLSDKLFDALAPFVSKYTTVVTTINGEEYTKVLDPEQKKSEPVKEEPEAEQQPEDSPAEPVEEEKPKKKPATRRSSSKAKKE